ncbi:MAG: glycosyltransferase family 4 protein [Hyphomicrobiales bacterium]
MKQPKIILISYRLGYNSLLYWDSILSAIFEYSPNLRVFTAWPGLALLNNKLVTEHVLSGIKYYANKSKINQRLYFFAFPFFILKIFRYKPDVIIVNEFNLAIFYTVLFKFLYRESKILLLVESDPFLGKSTKKENYFKKAYRKYIVKNVDSILTNNQLGKKYLTHILGANSERITTLPYLTSCPPKARSYEETDQPKKIEFLYIGQLVERKGIKFLLKAIAELPKNHQNKICLTIIGEGAERSVLEEFKIENNLDFVNFKGAIPFDQLYHYYVRADCFILPTLHDYRALVGFEAIQFGCAVITSIYDGSRFEIVVNEENGYIIDPEDISLFTNVISNLITKPAKLSLFKQKSFEISKAFTPDICGQNLVNQLIKFESPIN